METLRSFGGISGFPKPRESVHDAFIAGHASNAVSVALGMARARTQLGEDYSVIALLGDGALTGGLAYEGLSNAGQSGEPLIVILNDNGMSITKNVGGVAQHLAHQRLKPQYLRFKRGYRRLMSALPGGQHIYRFTHKVKTAVKETLLPCSLFEDMGFVYLGPVDGHDVRGLTRLLAVRQGAGGPGAPPYPHGEGQGLCPRRAEPPTPITGWAVLRPERGALQSSGPSYSSVFGETLCALAQEDRRVCAITAAMRDGTGLGEFERRFPGRFFDVGIAEGHAVAMAAGMAKQGSLPVFAVYSSFLQRGYDMLLHDVGILGLHVVLGVDRAGLVGEDGETHHGLFDVAYLSTVPGMTLYAPSSFAELRSMLRRAVEEDRGLWRSAIPGAGRGPTGPTAAPPHRPPAGGQRPDPGDLRRHSGPGAGGPPRPWRPRAAGRRWSSSTGSSPWRPVRCWSQCGRQAGCWCGGVRRHGLHRGAAVRPGWPGGGPPPGGAAVQHRGGIHPSGHHCRAAAGCAAWTEPPWSGRRWRCGSVGKKRLDVLLCERGLAESRQRAQADIMGGCVFVEGRPALKAGQAVDEEAQIEVRGQAIPYVSRGGLKLAKAMDVFSLDLTGWCAPTSGPPPGASPTACSSTARRRSSAVDTGYGKLAWKLRTDPRVVALGAHQRPLPHPGADPGLPWTSPAWMSPLSPCGLSCPPSGGC